MLQSHMNKAKKLGFLSTKNRDRLSIVAAILEIADAGACKTKIMFSCNLSFKALTKYLNLVVSAGFVWIEGSIYHLTEHGRDFLRKYQCFEERYVKVQIELEALSREHLQLSGAVKDSAANARTK